MGKPEWLRAQAIASCEKLGVKRIDLWQLHRVDPKLPCRIKSLIDDGIIRYAGLSEVSVADIEDAAKVFPVATVQNRYNLVDRGSEDVLDYCERHGIGFIPWFLLAAGDLAREGSLLDKIEAHRAVPSQIALAWVLKRRPGHAADPRHLEGQTSRGERRGGECRAHRRRVRRTRWRGPRRLGSGLTARHLPAGTTGLPVRWP